MGKQIADCVVMETGRLAPDVFSLWLEAPDIAKEAKAGQFVSLYSHDSGHLLPRPISLCEIDTKGGRIRLVYRVVGFGTAEYSMMKPGNRVRVMGPLGNGFPIRENLVRSDSSETGKERRVILVGGGIGIPPMLGAAAAIRKAYAKESPHDTQDAARKREFVHLTVVTGYRDRRIFLEEEFYEMTDDLIIATDDGSRGTKGTVIDAMNEHGVTGDVLYACGPTPMLRGVKQWAADKGIPAWLSLEERMACGIGACLGCVCQTTAKDDHSQVENARVCKDGPVFAAGDVRL